MKKAFIALLGILLLICLSVALIAPKYIGQQAKSGLQEYLQSGDIANLRQYGIHLDLIDYKRGYFSSQAKVMLTVKHPTNQQPLLANELTYHITHAPLTLSGFHLLNAVIKNSPEFTGQWQQSLPTQLLHAQANIDLLGRMVENIELQPFSIDDTSFPITRIDFGGINIHWQGHLKDYNRIGSGTLAIPYIEAHHQSEQVWRVDELSAQLDMQSNAQDNAQILNIDNISFAYQQSKKQTFNIHATDIEQIKQSTLIDNQYVPLMRTLSIKALDVAINNKPQAQLNNIQATIGLQKNTNDYELALDWQAQLTVSDHADIEQLPLLDLLPAQQNFSVHLSSIALEQLPAWSNVVESFWQPNIPMAQSLADFGQLLRLNIAKHHTTLTASTILSDDNKQLVSADIFIDENIDDVQKINTLINHGMNPHWFHDSHVDIAVHQSVLRKLKILPFLILLADKGVEIDDEGYVRMRATIVDQQFFINDKLQ